MAAAGTQVTRILGLTGAIGCGKSTVGDLLLEVGARDHIDADQVAHALMSPGTQVTQHIAETFGPDVMAADGSVNRAALGHIVFNDAERLRLLEAITHPAIRRAIRERLETPSDDGGVVVLDAVKLLQSELLPLADAVWVVRCDPEVQMSRLSAMRGMTDGEIRARLEAQPSFNDERVTAVIENSGSHEDLRREVLRAWHSLLAEWGFEAI